MRSTVLPMIGSPSSHRCRAKSKYSWRSNTVRGWPPGSAKVGAESSNEAMSVAAKESRLAEVLMIQKASVCVICGREITTGGEEPIRGRPGGPIAAPRLSVTACRRKVTHFLGQVAGRKGSSSGGWFCQFRLSRRRELRQENAARGLSTRLNTRGGQHDNSGQKERKDRQIGHGDDRESVSVKEIRRLPWGDSWQPRHDFPGADTG